MKEQSSLHSTLHSQDMAPQSQNRNTWLIVSTSSSLPPLESSTTIGIKAAHHRLISLREMTMESSQSARDESPSTKNLSVDKNNMTVMNPTVPSSDVDQLSRQLSKTTLATTTKSEKITTLQQDAKAIKHLLSMLSIKEMNETEPEHDFWMRVEDVDKKFIGFSLTLGDPFPMGWKKGNFLLAKFTRLNDRKARFHIDEAETKDKKLYPELSIISSDLHRLNGRMVEDTDVHVLLSLVNNDRITNPLKYFDLRGTFNTTSTHGFKIMKMIATGLDVDEMENELDEKTIAIKSVPEKFVLTQDGHENIITLVKEQRKAIAMDASNELIVNMDSGAGTGVCQRLRPFLSGVPHFELGGSRRMHPKLTMMMSLLLYDGTLTSEVVEWQRSIILTSFPFPNHKIPFKFIDFSGECKEFEGSRINRKEAQRAVVEAVGLMDVGVNMKEICILCMYEGQKNYIREMWEVFTVMTVEEVQGREFEAVIVLTTRTIPPSYSIDDDTILHIEDSIIDNVNLMTVACTRAKQAVIIIGSSDYLKNIPHWASMVEYAEDLDMIVP